MHRGDHDEGGPYVKEMDCALLQEHVSNCHDWEQDQ
jgi:hypothetical protein